jgi:hypothetical protein
MDVAVDFETEGLMCCVGVGDKLGWNIKSFLLGSSGVAGGVMGSEIFFFFLVFFF